MATKTAYPMMILTLAGAALAACSDAPAPALHARPIFADTMSSRATIGQLELGNLSLGQQVSRFVFVRSNGPTDIQRIELEGDGQVAAIFDDVLPVHLETFDGTFAQVIVVELTIEATKLGRIEANLNVDGEALPIVGDVVAGELFAYPTHQTFEASVGDQSVRYVKVRNYGATDVRVVGLTTDAPAFAATLARRHDGAIAPGDDALVRIVYTPTGSGEHRGTLRIHRSQGGDALVLLSGRAAEGPRARIEPESIDFGDVAEGETAQATVRIRNDGSSDLLIDDPRIVLGWQNGFAAKAEGTVVFPGQSVDVEVTFEAVRAGRADALLLLETNDPARPAHAIALSADSR